MSESLSKLVETWQAEKQAFEIVAERYHNSLMILSKLNASIYDKCKEENIDINSLKMNGENRVQILTKK